MKVQVEALEELLGPEDVDVDFRRVLKEARDDQGRKILETFSSKDRSFLVAERSRCDKYKRAPWRQHLCKRWMVASKLDRPGTADSRLDRKNSKWWMQRKIIWKVAPRSSWTLMYLPMPENLEVSLKYILKHATCMGSNTLPAFRHIRKAESHCGKQKTMVGKVREESMRDRRMRETSGTTLGIKEPGQELRPNSTLQTSLRQQSSSSAREEEDHWGVMERRRRIAVKNLARAC